MTNSRSGRPLGSTLWLLGVLSGCGDAPVVQAPPPPPELYRMRVSSSEGALGAIVVNVSGAREAPLLLPVAGVIGSSSSAAEPARLLLVGPLDGHALLEVRATTPGVAPSAVVVEASAGAAGGYRSIAANSVLVTWVAAER